MKGLEVVGCLIIFLFKIDAEKLSSGIKQKISVHTLELARLNGYRGENHTVITDDGYILQIHRLPGGRDKPLNCSLPPVLLMHGILCTSADWVIADPPQSLAFLLADKGYDVWMGNVRGNTYGRKNLYFDEKEDRFWDFTFHEVGIYDLPATIDYILNTTGHKSVFYVGHSMGTTDFFVLSSSKPEYDSKIQHMVALAPVAFLTNTGIIFQTVALFDHLIYSFVEILGNGKFQTRESVLTQIMKATCTKKINEIFCSNMFFILYGYDPLGFNTTLVPIIVGHDPAGTSIRDIYHYTQVLNSGRFQQYDFGTVKNLKKYGSVRPPIYNLSRISIPLTFFYSDNDKLADPKDVMNLVDSIHAYVDLRRVNSSTLNHLGFLWSKNAKSLIYDSILFLFESVQELSFPPGCPS